MSICHYFFCVCVFCPFEKSLSILSSGLSSLVGAQMISFYQALSSKIFIKRPLDREILSFHNKKLV